MRSSFEYFRTHENFMGRYLVRLIKKCLLLSKYLITKLIYNLLIPKNWNCRSIVTYFIFVSFSTLVLIHNQSNSNITLKPLSQSSIVENEIIQVSIIEL
jgi:hypothetical protein